MRLVVVSQATTLDALSKTLLLGSHPAATTAAALERVQALNPHLDLQHIAAGSVLLLPELPSVNPTAGRPFGGDVFSGLAADARAGLEAATQRIRAGVDDLAADRGAVKAALRTAAVKRIVDGDPTLAKQVDTAGTRSAADQQQAQDALATVEKLSAQVSEELSALARLFE